MSHLLAAKTLLHLPTRSAAANCAPRSNRRWFLQGLSAASSLAFLPTPSIASNAKPRLVVIGAGAGGSTFVRTIQAHAPDTFDITVITAQKTYNAPFALHGFNPQKSRLCTTAPVDLVSVFKRQGVDVVVGRVEAIELEEKAIRIAGSKTDTLSYDVLIAAPGISLNWDHFGLKGTPDKAAIWTSEATCQDLLNMLAKVPIGGTFGLVAPAGSHRCPPAVYERACVAAHWFKNHNKTAKILIVDDKDQYPMQAMFEEAYADYYEDMIEWIPREFHGGIKAIDLSKGTIQTDAELFTTDQLNVIPPQQAPEFLVSSGMADVHGYGRIRTPSMQSLLSKDVYIIGDAAAAGDISKSAVSAGVEARLAATDILNRFTTQPPQDKKDISDNCWTLVAPDDAISLGGTYSASGEHFSSDQRFMSAVEDTAQTRKSNAEKAAKWPKSMLQSLYGG